MLFNGEQVGDGTGPRRDVAVDPIDGTTLDAKGMPNAISVLAVADRGAMYDPSAVFYMEKLVTGPGRRRRRRHHRAGRNNLRWIAKAKGERVSRPHRRDPGPAAARGLVRRGARGRRPDQVHQRRRRRRRDHGRARGHRRRPARGIGGTPEGIIAACAIKCLGGVIQGRLWPRDDDERRKALDAGHDLDRVLYTDDLVTGENVFFCATGITDGELMQGVRYRPAAPRTALDRDAQQERHHPRGHQRAPAGQAGPRTRRSTSTPAAATAPRRHRRRGRRDRRRPRRAAGGRLGRCPGRGQRRARGPARQARPAGSPVGSDAPPAVPRPSAANGVGLDRIGARPAARPHRPWPPIAADGAPHDDF